MNDICILSNPVREYAWGSRTIIPELLGRASPAETPRAEMWLGAHPAAPSMVIVGRRRSALGRLIAEAPERLLGERIALRFHRRLPYLMKILAADQPLSIQVHPRRDMAGEGFRRENRLGLPLDDPRRNYRDDNHKPELLCALTAVDLLAGFRTAERILAYLSAFPQEHAAPLMAPLRRTSGKKALKSFFRTLMTLPENARTSMIATAVALASGRNAESPECIWVRRLHAEYPDDIGVLAPLFLNLLRLEPGRAIFLAPGTLHAYLKGAGVEVMASSDNVLRAGLTRKHVDPPELMRAACFSVRPPDIIRPVEIRPGEWAYPAPAAEFALSVIRPAPERDCISPDVHSLDILLCVEGEAVLTRETRRRVEMPKGTAVMVPADAGPYRLRGKAVIYKTTVPLEEGAP